VAVKCTRPPESTSEAINCLREIECFSTLTHPNVLPFLGACMADMDNCLLVTEFMTGGTLKEWLYGHVPGGRKPWRKLSERLQRALEVRTLPLQSELQDCLCLPGRFGTSTSTNRSVTRRAQLHGRQRRMLWHVCASPA
jgi:serine/threonine protein kinase